MDGRQKASQQLLEMLVDGGWPMVAVLSVVGVGFVATGDYYGNKPVGLGAGLLFLAAVTSGTLLYAG